MKNNEIHINVKKKLYEITILPSLTYGCQTWSLQRQDEDRVTICLRKIERSNVNIRKKTKIIDVRKKVRLFK